MAEFFDEDVVGWAAFAVEARGLGAEGVFEGVLGGLFFAVGGARAGGFLGVGAVGGEFAGGDFAFGGGRAPGALEGFDSGIGFAWRGRAFFDQSDAAHETPDCFGVR